MCACVRACVCVRACMHVCVRACMRVNVCVRTRARAHMHASRGGGGEESNLLLVRSPVHCDVTYSIVSDIRVH